MLAPAGEDESSVSTLGQPRTSVPSPFGVNHTPSFMAATPRAMRSVTRAGRIVAPRSLKTRTSWPSTMPRAAASSEWIHTSRRSARPRISWLSWIECVRARDLPLQSISGWRGSGSTGGIHVGMAATGPSPYMSGLAAMDIE